MEQFIARRVRRTTAVSVVCVSVLLGVAASRWGLNVEGWWFYALPALVIAAVAWQRRVVLLPATVIAGLLLGSVQGTALLYSLRSYQLLYGQEVTMTGTVSEDPTYSDKGNRQFFLNNVTVRRGGEQQRLPGQLFVSTPFSDVRRHDKVALKGELQDGFGPFQGTMYYAQVQKIGDDRHIIDNARSEFAAGTTSVLPEPHASLGLGFVIGMKSALTPELEDALRDLSLTHVVVASGYNLTILVRAAKRLREKRSKLQTLLMSLTLIGLFLFVTGATPSMVRAAAVSGLALLAWYFGRQFKPHVLLLLVMAGTALYNPLYLWGDLGWWLSFAAFAGIMIIAPLITERFYRQKQPSFVSRIAIEALVAQVMTMPIIMLIFGDVPLLGVIANVLIVPLVPFAMLATVVSGFTAMLLPTLAAFVAIPAVVVLEVIVSLISLLDTVPGTVLHISIGLPFLLIWYALAAVFGLVLWQRLTRARRQRVLMQQIV